MMLVVIGGSARTLASNRSPIPGAASGSPALDPSAITVRRASQCATDAIERAHEPVGIDGPLDS